MPDEKVAWAATTGATNAGAVFFDSVATDRTRVRLTLDFEPEGVVERIGDVLDVVQRQAVADLDRFNEFTEGQGSAVGGWRGTSEVGGVMSQEAQGQAIRKADDLPGDVVAVGPTGDTQSTLTTDPEPAPSSAPEADYSAVGHSGDPVAVDPEALGATTGTDEAWAPGGSGPGEDRGVRDVGARRDPGAGGVDHRRAARLGHGRAEADGAAGSARSWWRPGSSAAPRSTGCSPAPGSATTSTWSPPRSTSPCSMSSIRTPSPRRAGSPTGATARGSSSRPPSGPPPNAGR